MSASDDGRPLAVVLALREGDSLERCYACDSTAFGLAYHEGVAKPACARHEWTLALLPPRRLLVVSKRGDSERVTERALAELVEEGLVELVDGVYRLRGLGEPGN